jgi:F0F1-type ATP synthase membrane subunit b/b'
MGELFSDVLRGITAEPVRFIAEVVQSALVLVVLGWAGRRFARRRLAARRETIAAHLAEADAAERESVQLREEAGAAAARAQQEAPAMLRSATEQANRERQASVARIESEALEVVAQARRSVESDKERVRREASARLISLTTEAARRYLDEMLTEADRRALTRKAILAALEEIAAEPPPREAGVT